MLDIRFSPCACDLGDTKLHIPNSETTYDVLKPMIGGRLGIKHVRAHRAKPCRNKDRQIVGS